MNHALLWLSIIIFDLTYDLISATPLASTSGITSVEPTDKDGSESKKRRDSKSNPSKRSFLSISMKKRKEQPNVTDQQKFARVKENDTKITKIAGKTTTPFLITKLISRKQLEEATSDVDKPHSSKSTNNRSQRDWSKKNKKLDDNSSWYEQTSKTSSTVAFSVIKTAKEKANSPVKESNSCNNAASRKSPHISGKESDVPQNVVTTPTFGALGSAGWSYIKWPYVATIEWMSNNRDDSMTLKDVLVRANSMHFSYSRQTEVLRAAVRLMELRNQWYHIQHLVEGGRILKWANFLTKRIGIDMQKSTNNFFASGKQGYFHKTVTSEYFINYADILNRLLAHFVDDRLKSAFGLDR